MITAADLKGSLKEVDLARIFISHRGADTVEAIRLAEELKTYGHDCWLDVWRLDVGDSVVARINDGLADASYVVLCYSDSGVLAEWMSREWMSALARQLSGAAIRILPVRLTGGSPPSILADIKYADLVADWKSGMNALRLSIV